MSLFTPTATGRDPDRLICAAHELGHLVGFRAAGVPIAAIKIDGHGRHATGYVREAGIVHFPNAAAARHYLVALLAGKEAGLRWCDRYDLDYGNRDDIDLRFFHQDRARWRITLSESRGRTLARRLVDQQWPTITRLAPRLAERGRLDPAAR